MAEGWIKLYRKMRHHPRARDPEWVAVWVAILLQAKHEKCTTTFDGKMIELEPGQFVTGRRKLAAETGVSESNIYRTLNELESEQQITIKRGVKGSIITVRKWQWYQSGNPKVEPLIEQQTNSKRTLIKEVEKRINIPPAEKPCASHAPFPSVLAWVTEVLNKQGGPEFSRDECHRVWLQLEGGKDAFGNWYQFNGKRQVGDWRAEVAERLAHNREIKERHADRRNSSKGYTPQTNANTGKASQYRAVGKVGPVSNSGGSSA